MLNDATKREIDKAVEKVLKEASLRHPPIHIAPLLMHLEVHRDFYDLQDPKLLRRFWHKVKVTGRKLYEIVSKINLAAV